MSDHIGLTMKKYMVFTDGLGRKLFIPAIAGAGDCCGLVRWMLKVVKREV